MITISITSAGVPWSTADLARITPDPEAPLCSVEQQLEALGYRVTAIQGSGMEVSAEVERDRVTADALTDDDMRSLFMIGVSTEIDNACRIALGLWKRSPDTVKLAREKCAAALNAVRVVKTETADALTDETIRGLYANGIIDIDLKDRAMFGSREDRSAARAAISAMLADAAAVDNAMAKAALEHNLRGGRS